MPQRARRRQPTRARGGGRSCWAARDGGCPLARCPQPSPLCRSESPAAPAHPHPPKKVNKEILAWLDAHRPPATERGAPVDPGTHPAWELYRQTAEKAFANELEHMERPCKPPPHAAAAAFTAPLRCAALRTPSAARRAPPLITPP